MRSAVSTLQAPVVNRIQNTESQLNKGVFEQKIIRCDVVFGSPSLGCRGTGVCKIAAHRDNEITWKRENCRHAMAFLVPAKNGQGFYMVLLRETLCTGIMRTHLRHDNLEMKETCSIPRSIINALGLTTSKIHPGTYPIEERNGYFRIYFK